MYAWGIMKIVLETQIQTPFPNHSYKIFITDYCPVVEQRATLLEDTAQQQENEPGDSYRYSSARYGRVLEMKQII